MSNSANVGHMSVPAFNYTGQRVFDMYSQSSQFPNYNQNIPLHMSNAANNHGNMQTIPDVHGQNHYMPNFHGHDHNSPNIPFRNGNIPYHDVPHINPNEQNYQTKMPPDRQNHHNNKNHISNHRSDKKFSHRDEIGHGWGGGGNVGNSPAISALALLGFLFFLNLIQNSLQNNRMMMMTTTTTTTSNMTTTTTAGGSTTTTLNGRSGRERRKRDSDYYSFHRYIPDSIPSHPIRPIQHFLENNQYSQPRFHQPIARGSTSTFQVQPSENYGVRRDPDFQSNVKNSRVNTWTPLMKRLKRISTNCFQLFACTLGRGIIKKYGKPTVLMLTSVGRQLLPKTKTHWSTKVLRALTNGWKTGRKCSRRYNRCNSGDWGQWLETLQEKNY